MSSTLLIIVLSKKTLIVFVKTKPEHDKWRKHDTRGSMKPFSHLLLFAYRLYMTTATLLNGHLYTQGYIIILILCIPVPIFHQFLSRNVCSKMLFVFIDYCIYSHTTCYFWSYETKHLSLKSNLNVIPKCHKLTHISFFHSLSTAAYIHPHYMLLLIIRNQTFILK